MPTCIKIKLFFPHTGPASEERKPGNFRGGVGKPVETALCGGMEDRKWSFKAGFLETFDTGRESVRPAPGAVGPSLYKGASAPAEPPYLTGAMTQQEAGEDIVAGKGGGGDDRQ